jgi:molecular chaperone GrpE
VTDQPLDPRATTPEGEPAEAPSPEGGFGDAAGEAPSQTEVEEQVAGDQPLGDEPVGDEPVGDEPGSDEPLAEDVEGDTEIDDLALMKGSLADLTNDLQRLQAEYANYRKRVDRDRQLVAENAAYKALTPVIEVLDTIDRAREAGELEGGFKAVADQLQRAVELSGLVRFGEPGDAFDPTLHEALSNLGPDPEVEVTTCKHVAKAGYKIGDRVVRAAQVLVVEPAG